MWDLVEATHGEYLRPNWGYLVGVYGSPLELFKWTIPDPFGANLKDYLGFFGTTQRGSPELVWEYLEAVSVTTGVTLTFFQKLK